MDTPINPPAWYVKGLGCMPFACIVGLVIFASCYNVKKAVRDTTKAFDKFPDTTAAILRAKVPCITTASDTILKTIVLPGRNDTTYQTTERIVQAICDSVGQMVQVKVKYQDREIHKTDTILITKTITNKIEDKSWETRIKTLSDKANKYQKKYDWWFIAAIISWGILLLLTAGLIIANKNRKINQLLKA